MKRLISLLLFLVMAFTLCACDSFVVTFTPIETTSGETTLDETTPDGTTPDGTTPDGTTPDGTTPEETTPEIPGTPVDPISVSFELLYATDEGYSFLVSIDSEEELAYIELETFFDEVVSPAMFESVIIFNEVFDTVDWYVDEKLANGTTKIYDQFVVTIAAKETDNPEETTTPENNTPEETTPEPTIPDDKITITFYHTMGSNLQIVLERYIAEFNKLYPNIIVDHKTVGGYDDVREQIKMELVVGDHPNIAYCYPDHVATYNVAHAVQNLDEFISSLETVIRADGSVEQIGLTQEQIDDFIDAFYNEGAVYGDGKMYTLPMSKSTEVLYYNKTFFEEHNLAVPTTWEEMEEVCRQIKAIDPYSIPLGYDSEANWFITMCQQYNSPYTSATGNHYLFNNETNRNFVAMLREWYQKGYITTLELNGAYTSGLFTADEDDINCYMCIASSAGASHQRPMDYNGSYKFEVGITSIPQVDPSNPKVISQGPSLCIFKDSNKAEVLASWLFMKFLTTNVDFQAEFSMTSGYIPVIESVKDHPIYANELECANGYGGLPLLAAKVALEQADAYYTTPAFNGSSFAREEVGLLLQYCLIDYSCATSAGIEAAFARAIAECEYHYPSDTPDTPDIPDIPDIPAIYDTTAAADYIYALYKNMYVTSADFEVTSKVIVNGVTYTVSWAVDTDKVTITKKDNNTYIVNVDEESATEIYYILTATVVAPNGESETRVFFLTVPKSNLLSHEEYMNAQDGDIVTVRGIVVAINSKAAGNTRNHLFLADIDGKGGYYCYNLLEDPIADLGIEVGMIVEVTGDAIPYSGMQEVQYGTAKIVNPSKQAVVPFDLTEMFANSESLVNYVGSVVTFKGVTIAGQEHSGINEYLFFELNGVTSYVRTYAINFHSSLVQNGLADYNKSIIDNAHAEHFGWTANVTGMLLLYAGTPYLIPVDIDCFEYMDLTQKTDEEKVTEVLNQINISTSFTFDTVVDLPTSVYPEVVLTWAWASNNEAITVVDGKLFVTIPEEPTEVTVTVIATYGNASIEKCFTVKLSKVAIPVKDIIDMALGQEHNVYTESKYLVAGIITEVYNETYGNMRITDEFGNILTIYGTYGADGANRYDKLENKPVAGDYVVILGIVGQYNGTPQIKNGWIQSYTTPTSVADALAIGSAQEHNVYTEDKYVITGVITEVYNTTYGNMRITDGEGNILTVYGTYSADGSTRYDALTVKPVTGDVIAVYGILGQYNGTVQLKNGWIVAHAPVSSPEPPEVEESTPEFTTHEEPTPEIPEEPLPDRPSVEVHPVENTAYKFSLFQANLGETLFITGEVSGRYLATTNEISQAIDVYAEVVEDGFKFYILVGDEKQYLTVCKNGDGKISVTFDANGTSVYTYDIDTNAWVTNVEGNDYFLGAYSTFNTVSASKSIYITSENTGVSQFPIGLVSIGAIPETPVVPEEPEIILPEETTPSTPVEPSEPTPEEGTVNGVIADIAAANGWSDGNSGGRYDSFKLNEYVSVYITATATGSYGVNSGKLYGSPIDNWRIYQNEAATLTIAAAADKTIVSVKVTYTVSKTGILTLNGANVESETVVTVNANSVTFGVGNTGTATNGQVRITAIEVTYANAGELPEEPEVTTPEVPEETIPEETTPAEPEVNEPATDSTLTIAEVIALGASMEHNTYTGGTYYVTGVITEVYNTRYGNMKITDEFGNVLTIYGSYSADGSTRFDALDLQPVAGDTVTIYGIIGQYNGTPQIKNGWIVAHGVNTPAETLPEEEITTPEETLPEESMPEESFPDVPFEGKVTYTFENYEAGEQYAKDEVHKLDDMVTVITTDAHFTKQIRLYQQAENQYGPARNGTAIFQTASAIKSLSINAGEKKNPFEVYGSTNGTDWVLITTIIVETTEYVDFEIALDSDEYTYIKLATITGQARIAAVTFEF